MNVRTKEQNEIRQVAVGERIGFNYWSENVTERYRDVYPERVWGGGHRFMVNGQVFETCDTALTWTDGWGKS